MPLVTFLRFVLCLSFFLSLGCAPSNDSNNESPPVSQEENLPTPPEPPLFKHHPLSWETEKFPERKRWSSFLIKSILNDWPILLTGSKDIQNFCPRYNSLSAQQRANVWAQLIAAMAKFESNYNPNLRYHETSMGTDSVTRQPVYSEGLLQLSYQDTTWAKWCQFDWKVDRHLSATSPYKTVFDPYKNLHCGTGIMARQIQKQGRVVLNSGVYWAVLHGRGRYQRINNIKSMVQQLPFCR